MRTISRALKSVFMTTIFFISILYFSNAQASAAEVPSRGKAFNPDIGVNFLGLVQRGTGISTDRSQVPHNGLSLQEAEFQFTSDVDPYLRAVALFAVKQESGSTDFGIDPEEIYVETIALPHVTLRAGQFKLALGKHNQLHTHAFPFIDAPLAQTAILGDEGLNEVAGSAAALLPVSWYSEVILQAFNPSSDTQFNSPSSGNLGTLAKFKNLFDLDDDITLEIGAAASMAQNSFDKKAKLYAGDLTIKWRPAEGGKYRALIWSTEYLQAKRTGLTVEDTSDPAVTVLRSTQDLSGFSTWLQYQFAQRWWVQGRYEYLGWPGKRSEGLTWQHKQSALVGFFPSEFSGLRLQYDRSKTQFKAKEDHTIAFQYNISIGAHPAHAY